MLSRRASWSTPPNRLAVARAAAAARGARLLDLTESNPTRAGIAYPFEEMEELLRAAARAPYDPDPFGIRSAREALAEHLSRPGDPVTADDLVLTASTSEAYSFLFKLLGDPGDEIATHIPSYPLLDHLAELESLHLRRFPLHFHGARWELDPSAVASALSERTRALVAIHPNNPTGSFLDERELADLDAVLSPRQIPVISDEVFFDYPLRDDLPTRISIASGPGAAFALGGLSKSAGLPHWKLGWIRIGGPRRWRDAAREGLELISDSFLSPATPVQVALPEILALAPRIRAAILSRVRRNLAALDGALEKAPSIRRLPAEGGWSAVLRVPLVEGEEDLALALLEREGVVVHPGFFFDFASEGYLVVSLLTLPEVFEEGCRRVVRLVDERARGL
ncbi:MAG TPA: pyridoxal phosphate-dependent aminotransferase [Thermoanaerobaculia bacterium]